ncbi:MAG: biotin--[acetyl-CoA-carboxylase] ligase [Bacteroidetes bacterium]|nr:biotin--[acetyl-CoA-carboxylase] ligase [Bacteroidota bacterium]
MRYSAAFNLELFQQLNRSEYGRRLGVFDSLDSTNDFLKKKEDLTSGEVVLAETQTAGKGRSGRAWSDEKGHNLLFSLGLVTDTATRFVPLAPLLSAAAIRDALSYYCPEIKIKWPNDLLISGRKTAGILTEAKTSGTHLTLIIGIGINVNQTRFPGLEDINPNSLALATGKPVQREEVLARVLGELQAVFSKARWNPDPVMARYRQHCVTVAQRIRFEWNGETHEGVAEDIAPDGRLRIRTEAGILEFNGSEINHIRTAE